MQPGQIFTDNQTVVSMQGPLQAFKEACLFSPFMKPDDEIDSLKVLCFKFL